MKQLLLIDDDEKLAEPLQAYFARFDLCLASETRPLEGIERIKQESFELVVRMLCCLKSTDLKPAAEFGSLVIFPLSC